MRVLVHVEPLVMHGRPFHHGAWLARSAAFARTLAGRGHTFRFLLNEALAERAVAPFEPARASEPASGQGLPEEWVVRVRQDDVRRHFNAPNLSILEGFHHGRWPAEKVAAAGRALRERLGGFVPDVILTWTPAPHITTAFPGALVLHTGSGMFSRAPFPPTLYFDPLGLCGRSVPAAHARELLARKASEADRAWLDGLRGTYRGWLLSASPFHALERSLRERFPRLALLPLPSAGEAGFALDGPFRDPGEFLFHVLERLPEGLGLVVTEHPAAHGLGEAIDAETRAYVRVRWPQVTFVDASVAAHGSPMLMLHVDDVIGYSSSLALQAVFWQQPIASVGWGLARTFATVEGVECIETARPRDARIDRDGAMAWLLRHYFVPEALCLHDAAWIERFLDRARERHAGGVMGLEFFDAVADDAALTAHHAPPPAPAARGPVAADLVRDGAFEEWGGPRGAEQPRCWAFVPGRGTTARVTAGSVGDGPRNGNGTPLRYARIERASGGEDPSLLLQRIPDLDRLSGAFVTLDFWARGTPGAALWTYFYQQSDSPDGPRQGTAARAVTLDGEWRRYTYTVTLPEVTGGPRGEAHHTEVVFLLESAAAETRVELTGVRLGPGRFDG